jgi:hypothetical protein
MRNCYSACHADFEDTVGMVASSRGFEPEDVKEMLARMKDNYSKDPEYKKLRSQLPDSFPL